ncbi:ATPase [Metallumcola ferriviriculae]|uniref:ATPase n=1 Tax=Metallumcola ferriviriculae TaxID=3039180 RepID=A0AAU0UPS1_9FIRM|nr:ATPase [Desulfitibacteraceae bacterium MK1]
MDQLEGALQLLDQMEELLANSTRVPITGKVVVDQDLILDILDKVRAKLPVEFREAQQVNKERQRVMKDAKQEAERILEEARSRINRMISEEEIMKKAQVQAEEMVIQAKKTAQQIREGSTVYADDVMSNLESNLEKTLSVVRKGRQELKSSKARSAS